jgi:hypothetical protein
LSGLNVLKPIIAAIARFINTEKVSREGRANLIGGVLIVLLCVLSLIPPLVLEILKLWLEKPEGWTAVIPICGVVILAVYLLFSFYLISPRR